MNKNKLLSIITILMLVFPISVNAATSDTPVGSGLNKNICTSSPYQDDIISTSTKAYFSHCMKATCSNRKYKIEYYYDDVKVNCLNGNKAPYVKETKNGCEDYESWTCSGNEIKYCSKVLFYDCTRKSDGTAYKTTTEPTKPKTEPKTEPITEPTTKPKDSRLKSLTLSSGTISFNPDVYEYNIKIENEINNIQINSVPMDETSEISINGNTNLITGSVITITVKTPDDKVSIYKINVEKIEEIVLSSNTKLKSLTITNYDLVFNSRQTTYPIVIDSDVTMLEINYEVEDEKSVVEISGNDNLVNGSRIIISVTAEDGSVGNYYIDINVKKSSNFLTILFIIIIILALGAGGFYVYKKFFEGKNGEKYEYE